MLEYYHSLTVFMYKNIFSYIYDKISIMYQTFKSVNTISISDFALQLLQIARLLVEIR